MDWFQFWLVLVGTPLFLLYLSIVVVGGCLGLSDKFRTPLAGFLWIFVTVIFPTAIIAGFSKG